MKKKNPAAVALGSIKSAKKAAAVRVNGRKGGRPPKTDCESKSPERMCEQCNREQAIESLQREIVHVNNEWREKTKTACPKCMGRDDMSQDKSTLNWTCIQCGMHWDNSYVQGWNDGHQCLSAEGVGRTSDGYHTFDELYEHRCTLFLALMQAHPDRSWISTKHHDGTAWDGWFIAGMTLPTGDVTYHLPTHLWAAACQTGATMMQRGHEWDGHTSVDVIHRLLSWVLMPRNKAIKA